MTKKKKAPAGKKKTAKKVKVEKQARKPGFEQALTDVIAENEVREVGTRPGPVGRDPGAEDSQCPPDNLERLDRQLSRAPKALAPVLKIPFSIWAKTSDIPEMNLTDAEAEEWAEPIIALLEYYFPGKIPEIIWIWLMFLSATEKVIDSRVKIRYEKRKERAHPGTAPHREPAATSNATSQPAPAHNGAEPAQGYPQG